MYSAPVNASAPVGPRPFLCHNCECGTDGPDCECGWSACNCEACRQSLRKERYAPAEFVHDVVRGMLVIGCAGGPKPPATRAAPVKKAVVIEVPLLLAPSVEPAAPAFPSVPPARVASKASFRAMVRLCGLSHAEAAEVLNLSESAVKKKSAGSLGVTGDDILHLQAIWGKIVRGDLDRLPAGAVEASAALRVLRD